jgi:molybdenum cofactor synthesis domain
VALLPLDDALASYSRRLAALPIERLPVTAALGRVLAADVHAAHDLPRHAQSALDGYALRAADSRNASPETPVRLRVEGEVAAGRASGQPLAEGCAVRIYTGAWMPAGADAMLAQERVQREGDALILTEPVAAGRNVRARGEELTAGTRLAAAGTRISPGLLGSLIAGGLSEVAVHRRPRVRILVTGDELVAVGEALEAGELHDSNGPMLAALLAAWGVTQVRRDHIADDPERLRAALAADDSDIVVTCGGASVGGRDFLRPAATQAGFELHFWGVAQKPGKPMFFGTRGAQALLGLPGNPAAVLVCAGLHLRRIIETLEAASDLTPQWQPGRLVAPARASRPVTVWSADCCATAPPARPSCCPCHTRTRTCSPTSPRRAC